MTNELQDLKIRIIQLESKVNDGQQISHDEAVRRLRNRLKKMVKKAEDTSKK